MSASPKDLAVLLTCFYISMSYSAWLILGHSLTCGDTCYVLIRDMTVFYIVDPTTGKKYNSKDVYCPLIKIYCLVNDKNVSIFIPSGFLIFLVFISRFGQIYSVRVDLI